MQTKEFARSIDELVAVVANARTAIMCAEAAPSRCHRSLVGDALLVRGITVVDILSRTRSRPHLLTRSARVIGTTVTYAAETQPDLWGS
jgi:uncharacterized protein (DUF488 family)